MGNVDAYYNEFVNQLPTQEAEEEEMEEEEEEQKHEDNNRQHHQRQNSSRRSNVAVDEILPGQEMITEQTFSLLQVGDTVFIRNDIGDWEIMQTQSMDAQGSAFVGTFSDGHREKSIWAEQLGQGVVMAKYKKEKEEQSNSQQCEYII